LLDVGCGAGGALMVGRELGAEVSGLETSRELVELARARLPGAEIEVGKLEELPFADGSFDVVTGFNSFPLAADVVQALREARRVTRPLGTVAMLVWGEREHCDMAALLAVLAEVAPPPSGAPDPFGLAENGLIEELMASARLSPEASDEVELMLSFPNAATLWSAMSGGAPFVRAGRQAGEAQVREAVLAGLQRFTAPDGSVALKNRLRWVMALAD
jgi:SAM-dependent methyltransferase